MYLEPSHGQSHQPVFSMQAWRGTIALPSRQRKKIQKGNALAMEISPSPHYLRLRRPAALALGLDWLFGGSMLVSGGFSSSPSTGANMCYSDAMVEACLAEPK